MSKLVYVLLTDSKYGRDVMLFSTSEKRQKHIEEILNDWTEMDKEEYGEKHTIETLAEIGVYIDTMEEEIQ